MQDVLTKTVREHQRQMNEKMRQIDDMQKSWNGSMRQLRKEKDESALLLDQSHDERLVMHKELNRASKYIQ